MRIFIIFSRLVMVCGCLVAPFLIAAEKSTDVDEVSIGHTAVPQRVVSLNLCTDELLLILAAPEQISSVTWLVKDPTLSWMAEKAAAYPSNRGLAEEIIGFEPDLVLAGTFTTPATVSLLRRLGIPLVQVSIPTTVAETKQQIVDIAAHLGRSEFGQAVVRRMEEQIAALPQTPAGAVAPSALLYQPNGLTVSGGTLVDEIMAIAGLQNLATLRNLPNFTVLPLEVLVFEQPDLLIMNHYEQQLPSLAQELLDHPVLRKAFDGSKTVVVPAQSWSCGTPQIAQAIKILRHAALELVSVR